jgi:hypothetical protein
MTLTRLISLVGALLWLLGIVLAVVASRRARRFGAAGVPPRTLARIALLVFLLEVAVFLLTTRPLQPWTAAHVSPALGTAMGRAGALTEMSIVGWLVLGVALAWNTVLGVSLRRREASAELRKRTARAMDYRTTPRGR